MSCVFNNSHLEAADRWLMASNFLTKHKNLRSTIRGIIYMKWPHPEPKPGWSIHFGRIGWWGIWWTPAWHEGRGPYISIGLGLIAIYRGY